MSEDAKRVIEINGIKMEVDLRNCKRIDNFKVGDNVKLLVKQYGDSFKDHAGVIVGFDEFKMRPTIIVAYLEVSYSSAKIDFAYINKDTQDIEIVMANENDIPFNKWRVLELLDREIANKQKAVEEAEHTKAHFLEWFGKYFHMYDSETVGIGGEVSEE